MSSNKNNLQEYLNFLDYAKLYYNLGFSIIPLKPKSKQPLYSWKQYTQIPHTLREINYWFSGKNNNIAIICGEVSQNLIVLDFDDPQTYKSFVKKSRRTAA